MSGGLSLGWRGDATTALPFGLGSEREPPFISRLDTLTTPACASIVIAMAHSAAGRPMWRVDIANRSAEAC
jgi:hypothetical protein